MTQDFIHINLNLMKRREEKITGWQDNQDRRIIR